MKANLGIGVFAIVLSFAFAGIAGAEEPKYVGVDKCKLCHIKQYKSWQNTKHAKALDALKTDEAKKHSAEPSKDAKCLICHTTGYGKAGGYVSADDAASAKLEGVQCEVCHGPGEKYKDVKIMKDKALALKNGLIEPSEKTCLACHNNKASPTFKDGAWDYNTYYEKIKH